MKILRSLPVAPVPSEEAVKETVKPGHLLNKHYQLIYLPKQFAGQIRRLNNK